MDLCPFVETSVTCRSRPGGLVYKMHKLQFPIQQIRFIHNYLRNRTCTSKFNDALSQPFPLRASVPQGGPKSSDLYSIYVSDIPTKMPNCNTKVQLLADDTLLTTTATSLHTAKQHSQKFITKILEPWLGKWRIKVNPTKSDLLVVTHSNYTVRNNTDNVRLTLHGQPINKADSVRYLGVYLDKFLNYSESLSQITSKVNRRNNLLRMLRCKGQGTFQQTLLHCYKTFIQPCIEYGHIAIISDRPFYYQRLFSMGRRVLRSSLGLHPRYPSNLLHEDLQLEPLQNRFIKLKSNFLHKQLMINSAFTQNSITKITTITKKRKRKYIQPILALVRSLQSVPEQLQEIIQANNIPNSLLPYINSPIILPNHLQPMPTRQPIK